MRSRRRTVAPRDQSASAFSAVLHRLCDALGSLGAALVDPEGETVDYAGSIDPFDIKVAAAEWVVVMALLRESKHVLAKTAEVALRGTKKGYYVLELSDGYALVVQLSAYSFSVSHRAVQEAVRELSREAGLDVPRALAREPEQWHRVDVRCSTHEPKRPKALWVGSAWCAVEVLGRWSEGEDAGYRVRLPTGAELTLVRERFARWYTDTEIAP